MAKNAFKVLNVAHHRNGTFGNGFHVVTFKNGNMPMVGIVFEETGNCAVFNTDLLSQGNILFGENSWRCEDFEKDLRKAIEEYEESRMVHNETK